MPATNNPSRVSTRGASSRPRVGIEKEIADVDHDASIVQVAVLICVSVWKWAKLRIIRRAENLARPKEIAGVALICSFLKLVEAIRLHQRTLVVLPISWKALRTWESLG